MQRFLHFLSTTVVITVAICFLVKPVFPVLHDFPEWMYQGWLAHELIFSSNSRVSNAFALAPYPVPNSITQFCIALLNNFASPLLSGKIWFAIYLIYASIVCASISRLPVRNSHGHSTSVQFRYREGPAGESDIHRHDGAINLLLTMTITLGPGFWNGYANFQFALLFWGNYLLLMRLHRDGIAAHVVLAGLIFFSHASVFITFAGFVFARALFGQLNWRHVAAIAPFLALFVWYLHATVDVDKIGPANALGFSEWVQYKVYTVAKQGYFHNFILADGTSMLSSAHPVYLLGVGLNLGVAMIIIFWLLYQCCVLLGRAKLIAFSKRIFSERTFSNHAARKDDGKSTSAQHGTSQTDRGMVLFYRMLLLSLLTLLLLFLAAGKNNFGVVNLGERFFIAALLLALIQLQCNRLLRNLWVTLAAIGAVYIIVATVMVTRLPIEAYSVERSTTSSTLDGSINDIYANSRHKLFNHRLFIYADRGIWLENPNSGLLPLEHITSFVVPR